MSTQNRTIFAAFVAVMVSGFMGCSTSEPVSLKGAGATAPYLLYAKWVEAYRAAEPLLNLQYEPKGSGAGIEALKARSIDFAASDIPLTEEEIASMVVKPLHFPTAIEAIVPIPKAPILYFTGEVLAGIFSGHIRNSNDPSIAALNPKASLPANVIEVVHRSDGSGSTYALTDYLSEVSESWKKEIGRGATVKWPTGNGASGNGALAQVRHETA
jgi:phosphate transport system substrate-binding protein